MASAFEISLTTSMTALSALTTPVPDPEQEFSPFSGEKDLGDATQRGLGFPMAVWHWKFLTSAQYAQLRTFCAGKSASIYIKTPNDANTFTKYTCVVIWPQRVKRDAGRAIDVTLGFRLLVAA